MADSVQNKKLEVPIRQVSLLYFVLLQMSNCRWMKRLGFGRKLSVISCNVVMGSYMFLSIIITHPYKPDT